MMLVAIATTAALAAVYGLEALSAESAPAHAFDVSSIPSATGGAAEIARAEDGHYWAEATMDGRPVRVLVDTGASMVALTRDDALRLGHRLVSSDFDQTVRTAGGETRAALIFLRAVAVDGVRVESVEALVLERGLDTSLLGMSYLGRLSRIEVTPDRLTLAA